MVVTSGEGALGAEVVLGLEHTGLLCGEGTHVGMGPGSGYSTCFLRQAPSYLLGSPQRTVGATASRGPLLREREREADLCISFTQTTFLFSLTHILFFNMLVWTGHTPLTAHLAHFTRLGQMWSVYSMGSYTYSVCVYVNYTILQRHSLYGSTKNFTELH